MKLSAKLKNSAKWVQSHLNLVIFLKVTLNPLDRILLNRLPKVSSWPSNHFSAIKKGGHRVCF